MKTILLTLFIILSATPVLAETIAPSEAQAHVGQTATVEGIVSEVHHATSGRATFIDMVVVTRTTPLPELSSLAMP